MKVLTHKENGKTYNIYYSFRFPQSEHKEYIENLILTFGVRYIQHYNAEYDFKYNALQICKQDSRGVLSVTLLENGLHGNQNSFGKTAKDLIKFMQGFVFDKKWISRKKDK